MRPRPLTITTAACFALGAAIVIPRGARADPRTLSVERATDAAECPDAARLAAAVGAQRARDADADAALATPTVAGDAVTEADVRVAIARDEDGLHATVTTRAGSRTIHDRGPTCEALADALAFAVALILDESPAPTPTPAPTPPTPTPTPTPAPTPPTPRALRPSVPPRGGVAVVFGAGPLVSFGLLAAFAIGAELDVDARVARRLELGASGAWLPRDSVAAGDGAVVLSLVRGAARACFAPFGDGLDATVSIAPCAGFAAGALRGRATGFSTDGAATRPWLAIEAGARLRVALGPSLGVSANALAVAPLAREAFEILGQGVLFTTPVVGLVASVTATVSLGGGPR